MNIPLVIICSITVFVTAVELGQALWEHARPHIIAYLVFLVVVSVFCLVALLLGT